MARMPQIPAPDFSGRPGGNLGGRAEAPDIRSIQSPFEDASRLMQTEGDRFERLQAQRDEAAARLQKSVDGVTAERMRGDHEEKGRNLLNELQTQAVSDPNFPAEKVPEEFRRQLREMTDSEIRAAPSADLAVDLGQKYAHTDNQLALSAQAWVFGRQAQQAKDGVYKITQSSVREAQAQATVPGLSAAIASSRRNLGPLLQHVHGADAAKVMDETSKSMASSWVEANGPSNPAGVRSAIEDALATKKGPLWDNIPAHDLVAYQKRLDGWSKGYGERQRSQVAAEAVDFNTKTLDLFRTKDLDSKNFYQMRDELQRKQFAIKSNPQYADNPGEKVQQSEIVQTQMDTLDALRDAAQNGGHWGGKADPKKTAGLFKRYEALSKSEQRAPNDLLKVLQVQRDLAQAQSQHWIAPGDAETLTRGLQLLTGKSLAQKNGGASKVGPLKSPIEPNQPRVVGSAALDSYMKSGAYGRLSESQSAAMRVEYHRLVNDASENGRNLDEKTAQKTAQLAIQHVLTREKVAEPEGE